MLLKRTVYDELVTKLNAIGIWVNIQKSFGEIKYKYFSVNDNVYNIIKLY